MECNIYLEIEHINKISYYELSLIWSYFNDLECWIYDSDDAEKDIYYNSEEYCKLYTNMIKLCLTLIKSVVIYNNNWFVKEIL
jgi:hypothetical protein